MIFGDRLLAEAVKVHYYTVPNSFAKFSVRDMRESIISETFFSDFESNFVFLIDITIGSDISDFDLVTKNE
jgi:hypothetical protein